MKKNLSFLMLICMMLVFWQSAHAKEQTPPWAQAYVGWWQAANPSTHALFTQMEVRSAKHVSAYNAHGTLVDRGFIKLTSSGSTQIVMDKIGTLAVHHIPPRIRHTEAVEEIPPAITLKHHNFIEDFEKVEKSQMETFSDQ